MSRCRREVGADSKSLHSRRHQGVQRLPIRFPRLDDVYCMAVAKFWDAEWEIYSKIDDLYAYMRDKRGYDAMDEYIREDVLLLRGIDYTVLEKLVGECASRVYNALRHQSIESGTKEAFNAYVSCLHQLYLFGAAMQLNRMGYHMTKMN